MIVVDSSVWIDWLRGAPTTASLRLSSGLDDPAALATTEPIVMELLAGARDESALAVLTELTSALTLVTVHPHEDFAAAATLYRAARDRGQMVRRMLDCLIAAVAIRAGAELWHKDADFAVLASLTPLAAVDLR